MEKIQKNTNGPGLIRKGLSSLKHNGVKVTAKRVFYKLAGIDPARKAAERPLFTPEELEEQRRHSFPRALRFSLAAPLYNTPEKYLKDMIESVLAQTYPDWELCLADGSDEDHPEVGRICAEYACRVRLHLPMLAGRSTSSTDEPSDVRAR